MAKSDSTRRTRTADSREGSNRPATRTHLPPPADVLSERTYSQSEISAALGALQADVGTMLTTIHSLAHQARRDGSISAHENAVYVTERFVRDIYLQIDNAMEAVGCGRMGYFDEDDAATEGESA